MSMGRGDNFRDSEPQGRSFDDSFGRSGPMGLGNGPRGDGEPFTKQGRFEPLRDALIPPR